MMRSRNIWLLTALVIAGVCVLPVWQGFELIRYSLAGDKREAVLPWINVAGLAFTARRYALTSTNDSSDDKTIRERRDELVDMLAIRPLSSYYWLQLAEIRVDANEVLAKASAALELSILTGANEGYMVSQRGMYGIWQWETLSPEYQTRAAADLAARRLSGPNAAWMRKTLSEKSEQVRQAISSALQAQGFPKGDFAWVGL
jgi:hypothetical protein